MWINKNEFILIKSKLKTLKQIVDKLDGAKFCIECGVFKSEEQFEDVSPFLFRKKPYCFSCSDKANKKSIAVAFAQTNTECVLKCKEEADVNASTES